MEKEIAIGGIWLFAAATVIAPRVSGGFMIIAFVAAVITTWILI